MVLDLTFFLFAIPAVLIAGISKGGFGSGVGFVAAPLMAMVVEPVLAVGIMLPLLMLMDVAGLKAYWRQWDWPASKLLILGSVPGILLGAALFRLTDPDLFKLLIGVICFLFVGWQSFQALGGAIARGRDLPGWAGWLAGGVSGFTSFISHAGGPPVSVYLLSKGLGKTTYQATTVVVFWAINLIKFPPYAMLGFFTADSLKAGLMLVPVAFLGVWIGVRLHHVVPERAFFGLTYALLLGTGGKLIWDALA